MSKQPLQLIPIGPRIYSQELANIFLFLKGAKLVAKVVIGVKFVDGKEQTDGIIVRLPMNAILCQTTCEPR